MDRKQAVEELKTRYLTMSQCLDKEELRKANEAIDLAINALRTEPCEDAISRETVASEFADWFGYNYQNQIFYKRIKSMPSVTAEKEVYSTKAFWKAIDDAVDKMEAE